MNLIDMAKQLNKIRITQSAGQPIYRNSIRTTASDLLTDLQRKYEFDDVRNDFTGSIDNQSVVINAIFEKYGHKEAENYKPTENVKAKTHWLAEGYTIIKGEKPLCYIHTWKDKILWTVPMWHEKQVELNI